MRKPFAVLCVALLAALSGCKSDGDKVTPPP